MSARFLLGGALGLGIAIGNAHAASVTLQAAGGSNRIALSWAVSGNLAGVQVMRDTDANPAGRQRVAILGAGTRSFTDTTVQAGRQYWYWIKYTDTAGAVGNSNAGSATADGAFGFGRNVTGGAGGSTVRVSTPQQLTAALCGSFNSQGHCSDSTPRIIEVASVIDATGTEGVASQQGCYYSQCTAPIANERLIDPRQTHCSGRPVINITYDVAGTKPFAVGSNKTLIGIGAKAGLKGRGLIVAGGNANVIVRNLSITDINAGIVFAGDGITLDNTDRVWIDHNRFTRIGRQMIVSGWGKASNVTISNNDFDGTSAYSSYCNGRHYWNVLLVGADDSITLAGNWFRNFSGRAPKIGTADGKSTVQLVNNLFENGSWHAIDSSAPARLLVEGNYFRNVSVPILKGASAGYVYAPLAGAPTSATTACSAALGRDCVANTADPAPQANGFTLDSIVLDAARQSPSGAIVAPYAASLVPTRVPAQAGPQATLP